MLQTTAIAIGAMQAATYVAVRRVGSAYYDYAVVGNGNPIAQIILRAAVALLPYGFAITLAQFNNANIKKIIRNKYIGLKV